VSGSFCSKCGAAIPAGSSFCAKCGAPVQPAAPSSSAPIAAPTSRKRTGWLVGIIVLIVIVILVALAVIPVSRTYSYSLTSSYSTNGTQSATFPCSGTVTGIWKTASGDSVTLTITDASGNTVYSSDGASGGFSFTASNQPYQISTSSFFSETTSITGHYSCPYL
jgi:hypothetical protein